VIAILAPGQGSQSPGMLSSWLALPGAEPRVRHWSDLIGIDLVRLGTTADAEEIKDTAVTQPLIVALALLAYEELARRVELPADAPVAGHSVGELAAAAIAGTLVPDDAVRLAAVRGAEMAAACALAPTGMSAVMLGDPDEVLARLAELGLDPANRNGAGQIVAAGALDALAQLTEQPPPGAKVRPLQVAGAFHTRYMAPAQETLAIHAKEINSADPARPLLSNADGTVVIGGGAAVDRLVNQVTSEVRWDLCMRTLADMGVTVTVELPPAGALTGLIKRELKSVVTATIALKTPEDLDKVAQLIAQHGLAA
jgi:[acyl-carrier-protein] S-malonyltransferase